MYDLIVIGGGPGAMAAAIYSARYMVNTLVIADKIGGAIVNAHDVQNYPGFKQISGMDLMKRMEEQVGFQGVEIKIEEITKIDRQDNHFIINGNYKSKAVILAIGTERRKLDVPGEEEFISKGVSYCATCDAPFYRDRVAGVTGGGDSAAMAAQLLTEYAEKVYIIYRRDKMRAEPARVKELENNPKVEFIFNTNVTEIKGEKLVESVVLDREYKGSNMLKLNGLFIEIGSTPSTYLTKLLGIELNEKSLIKVDAGQRTNINGIYAAGDITTNSDNLWQIATAISEGAIAARSVYYDLKGSKI